MQRAAKEQEVAELRELIVGRTAVVLTDYQGMTVEAMYELRRQFDKAGVGFRVVKNTLCKLAIAETPYELLASGLVGPVGVAYSDDPVAPAKVLSEFTRKNDKLTVKFGYLDGAKFEATDLDALAKLPGKDALRAQLLSIMNAPATKFVGVLAAGPRSFITVLGARGEALGDAA